MCSQNWQSALLSIARCDLYLQWPVSRILTGLLRSFIIYLNLLRFWQPKKQFDCRKPVFVSSILCLSLPLLTSGTLWWFLVLTLRTLLLLNFSYLPVFHFICILFTKHYHWASISRYVRNLWRRTLFSFEVWFVSLSLKRSIDFLSI